MTNTNFQPTDPAVIMESMKTALDIAALHLTVPVKVKHENGQLVVLSKEDPSLSETIVLEVEEVQGGIVLVTEPAPPGRLFTLDSIDFPGGIEGWAMDTLMRAVRSFHRKRLCSSLWRKLDATLHSVTADPSDTAEAVLRHLDGHIRRTGAGTGIEVHRRSDHYVVHIASPQGVRGAFAVSIGIGTTSPVAGAIGQIEVGGHERPFTTERSMFGSASSVASEMADYIVRSRLKLRP